MTNENEQLDWFRENLAAYIAGGLSPDERERLEQVAQSNDVARTELEEHVAFDLSLRQSAGMDAIVAGLEDRVITALNTSRRWTIHPTVRRAALATAACMVLGAFGYLASSEMESGWLLGLGEPAADRTRAEIQQIAATADAYRNDFSDYGVGNAISPELRARRDVDAAHTQVDLYNTRQGDIAKNSAGLGEQASEVKKLAAREEEKENTVDALVRNATDLTREGKYKEAAAVTNQILVIDPKNDYAVGAKPLLDDRANFQEQRLGWTQSHRAYNMSLGRAGNEAALGESRHGYDDYLPTSPSSAARDGKYNFTAGDADGDGIADRFGVNLRVGNLKGTTYYAGTRVVESSAYFDPALSGISSTGKQLEKAGAGTLTLKGENTYTGETTVTGGTVALNGGTLKVGGQTIQTDEHGGRADLFSHSFGLVQGLTGGNAGQSPATQPAVDGRMIIRTGELEFEVDRFDSAAAIVGKIANDEQGFVATTSSDKLANGKVRGAIVVRIPPDHLDAFVLQLRALGDLKSQRIGSQDIGKEYTDLASELRADRAMEERLLELIKSGKGEIKDLLAAEKELATWRGKIEKIIGQMKFFENQVALSTLTITLMEKDIATAAATVEQETINAGVEADDVEKARETALSILADAKARIVSADLKKMDAGQMASTIVADIPSGGSGPVIDRIKQLGKVARLEVNKSTTTDPNNPATPTTRVEKKDSRLTLSLYNVANVAPRQSTRIQLATADATAAYNTIVAKVIKAGGRVVSGGSAQGQSDNSRADARIEVPADAADAFLADLKALGEIVTLITTDSPDTASVTSSKRGFVLAIDPAASLPARQSANFRIETGDVEQASMNLQSMLLQTGGRVLRSEIQSNPGGVSTATLSMELPLAKSPDAVAAVRGAGKVLALSTSQDASAPTGPLAKSRIDITFTTAGPITGDTGGLLANLRHGLSLSARGLLLSLQFIVIGLCFVLPWALVVSVAMKFWRRRKPAAPAAT